ncbi:Exodeoxyribonuclease VII small subunit [Nakamurella panacisegetis]|uniref:Exodeoxyribonuclease 7 small subunit n=1 Tax=Nakamurella panacisegetis TaxID=1090615 RepID=A0A1H0IDT0_9ACTN|nr:exodeoxyribonuclease VII small subunit [Nakamurella panacisegetis]SDO29515.1 Exodeoxyribonuclease VII small subunit [Nakamurella panacisegetis]
MSPKAASGPDAPRPADQPAAAPESSMSPATYELAKDELATVVAKLESGGLSLDESLTLWERGEHLAAVCNRFLDGARERVEKALAAADETE